MLIIERADAKGESAGEGALLAHVLARAVRTRAFFFIWFGDILFLYAAVGCVAFRFRNWEPRRLINGL